MWLNGKATMEDLEHMSLEDAEMAGRALDAWQDAEYRSVQEARKR